MRRGGEGMMSGGRGSRREREGGVMVFIIGAVLQGVGVGLE